jgi:acyl-coenzyme A synthetase/AMP-(fatty) acid ligase
MKRDFEFFKFERVDPEETILLPFSSGTTGLPKVRDWSSAGYRERDVTDA